MMDGSFSIRDLLQVPGRHPRKVASCFFGTLAIAVLALWFWPRTYVSEAKLFIRLGRESVTLDPTTQVGQNIAVTDSRENEINSVMEVIQSRAIAMSVVDRLGAEAILHPGAERDREPTPMAIEQAVTKLQKSLDVFPSMKRSNVITLRLTSRTPAAAQRILATVLAVYDEEHVRLNQVPGSYAFFQQQTELLQSELETAKHELRDAKNQGDLASVDGQRQLLEAHLAQIKARVSETEANLAGSQAKLSGLRELLTQLPERLVSESESGFDNTAADEMRAELYSLQIAEKELLAKFTESHPKVRAIRRQVEAAQQILHEQPIERVHITENVNPAYKEVEVALLQEQANAAGLLAQHEKLAQESTSIHNQMRKLNESEILIADLTRNVELLEGSYRKAYAALEQSRISDALEKEKISNVNVVQAATFQRKPVAPHKLEVLVLAFFVATFGSYGLALVCDTWAQHVTSASLTTTRPLAAGLVVGRSAGEGSMARETASTVGH
ncbi:MAG: hypothetical protein KDA92_10300 [Planctomycetales bacterium]|nr:hypothetical protein [Planctomycetales bacterium]